MPTSAIMGIEVMLPGARSAEAVMYASYFRYRLEKTNRVTRTKRHLSRSFMDGNQIYPVHLYLAAKLSFICLSLRSEELENILHKPIREDLLESIKEMHFIYHSPAQGQWPSLKMSPSMNRTCWALMQMRTSYAIPPSHFSCCDGKKNTSEMKTR